MPFNTVPPHTAPTSIWNLASRSPAMLFILLYFAFQVFYLTGISNGAGVDDAEQLAYMGALQWGYGGSQPPLYTWVNSLASSLFGISLFTIYLVKFSMLASTFASIYFGARLLNIPRAVAAAGMLGVFLLPQIAWESQRTLTHSVGGTAGCAWAFLTFAWYMRSQSWLAAAIFGVAIADSGCGLKAVHTKVFRELPFFDGWHRYLPALVMREGFGVVHIEVVDRPRLNGQSNYGILDRGLRGIVDLCGVWWLKKRRKTLPNISEIHSDLVPLDTAKAYELSSNENSVTASFTRQAYIARSL